jgi:hypothetical protein
MSVNTPTAKACSGNGHMSDPEPKTASLIAIYGNEVSMERSGGFESCRCFLYPQKHYRRYVPPSGRSVTFDPMRCCIAYRRN